MKNKIIFQIAEEDLQNEAINRIGRKLTDNEIDIAKDGIEWGISEPLDITYNTIFTEMTRYNNL
ncbi:MAG: hypothetical protein LBS52_09885 [Dysgonamonadaceae bacterium]|jgi:hypothetical protein|nr:hypothetical protein [Dysgonamonadaceae bacterium]